MMHFIHSFTFRANKCNIKCIWTNILQNNKLQFINSFQLNHLKWSIKNWLNDVYPKRLLSIVCVLNWKWSNMRLHWNHSHFYRWAGTIGCRFKNNYERISLIFFFNKHIIRNRLSKTTFFFKTGYFNKILISIVTHII